MGISKGVTMLYENIYCTVCCGHFCDGTVAFQLLQLLQADKTIIMLFCSLVECHGSAQVSL